MRYGKKQSGEVSTSNLVSDPELTRRFQAEATRVASLMQLKYYQVFNVMEVEDVVNECWKKVLSQDISFNPEKGAKFETFVHMIVNAKLIDLTRSLNTARRIPVVWSLDAGADNDHDESNTTTRFDLISDDDYEEHLRALELMQELQSYTDLFNNLPELPQIISLYLEGYTSSEVSGVTGVSEVKIKKIIKLLKEIISHRRNGSDKSLGDIIYYESQGWEENSKRKDFVLNVSALITDTQTKIKLSDIVKGVLKGWSYQRISESLNTEPSVIQETLSRYETIMV